MRGLIEEARELLEAKPQKGQLTSKQKEVVKSAVEFALDVLQYAIDGAMDLPDGRAKQLAHKYQRKYSPISNRVFKHSYKPNPKDFDAALKVYNAFVKEFKKLGHEPKTWPGMEAALRQEKKKMASL
jgi:hypothetical protein